MMTQILGNKAIHTSLSCPESLVDAKPNMSVRTTQSVAMSTTAALCTITTTTMSDSITNVPLSGVTTRAKGYITTRSDQSGTPYVQPLFGGLRKLSDDWDKSQLETERLDNIQSLTNALNKRKQLEKQLMEAYSTIEDLGKENAHKDDLLSLTRKELDDIAIEFDVQKSRMGEMNAEQVEKLDEFSRQSEANQKLIINLKRSLNQSRNELDMVEQQKCHWEDQYKVKS